MNERTNYDSDREPAELERDIDRTRASLGRTVDELEQRLSPGQLLDQALQMTREHGGEFATNLGRSVKNNPVPMLLTGVGLTWMIASSNEPRAASWSPGAGEAAGERVRGAKDSLADRARSAGASLSGSARGAGHSMSHAAESAGERLRAGAYGARSGFERMMEEQPLVVGALGIALGAAIGAAFPRTEQEDRLLGDTRDSLADRARQMAGEAYQGARDTAEQAASAVQDASRESAGDARWDEVRPGTEH